MHEFSVKFNGQSKKMELGQVALMTNEKFSNQNIPFSNFYHKYLGAHATK
jgi:hypothetical protein